MDNRAERCRALFEWYEEHGLPDNPEVAISAVAAVLTGVGEEPQSLEERVEALERVVMKLADRMSPPDTMKATKGPTRFGKLYTGIDDFREKLINEAEKTPSARDRALLSAIITRLDEIIDENTEE